jgi:hypothetical protein
MHGLGKDELDSMSMPSSTTVRSRRALAIEGKVVTDGKSGTRTAMSL